MRPRDAHRSGKLVLTTGGDLGERLQAYASWLDKQPLAANTKRNYAAQVAGYGEFLSGYAAKFGDPLSSADARDYAVRDYKVFIKTQRRLRPRTVNLALAAICHFYQFLGLGDARVRREELPHESPRALSTKEQIDLLRAAERCPRLRDRAITVLLLYTGVRLGECAALDTDDVRISARKGVVVVRSGKGETYREINLNAETRKVLRAYLRERVRDPSADGPRALFLNRRSERLSTRSIDATVRRIGKTARLDISAHVLRHTCLTSLVRKGYDLVLVADIAGHRRLDTTRRYTLSSAADRAKAMEDIQVEY
jgi:integrase/recombinase XerC